jgi:hypothetical protein
MPVWVLPPVQLQRSQRRLPHSSVRVPQLANDALPGGAGSREGTVGAAVAMRSVPRTADASHNTRSGGSAAAERAVRSSTNAHMQLRLAAVVKREGRRREAQSARTGEGEPTTGPDANEMVERPSGGEVDLA